MGICQKPPDPSNAERAVFIGIVREVYPKSREQMDQIQEEFRRLHPELTSRAGSLEFRKEFVKYLWRGSLSQRELEQLEAAGRRELAQLMLDYRRRVRIHVVENFSGADGAEFEAYTPLDAASCGVPFNEGESYLVDADRSAGDSGWRVFSCSRTETLAKATEDIEWLRAWKQGRSLAGRIQGVAEPGARIHLLGGQRALETTADNLGLFEFKNLDRRHYDVQRAGGGERRPVDLVNAGCAQVFLPRKQ